MSSPVTIPRNMCDCHGNPIRAGMTLQGVHDHTFCKIVCLPTLYALFDEAMNVSEIHELENLPEGAFLPITDINPGMWEIKP